MNRHLILALAFAFAILVLAANPAAAQGTPAPAAVPKYDVSTEVTVKGTIDDVIERDCPVSHGMGTHIVLKLADGKTMQVHVASTKFLKTYEMSFKKGEQLQIVGSKVDFEGAEAIFAREVKRGDDLMQFRDKDGKPVW